MHFKVQRHSTALVPLLFCAIVALSPLMVYADQTFYQCTYDANGSKSTKWITKDYCSTLGGTIGDPNNTKSCAGGDLPDNNGNCSNPTPNSRNPTVNDPGLVCENNTCNYTPLEPLPGLPSSQCSTNDFYSYLNGIITLLIIIGSMLAVVRFSIGGVMYMTSDVAGVRSQAKSQMWACVWGLLLLISSVYILKAVNPQLININLSDIGKLAGLGNGGQSSQKTDSNCADILTNILVKKGGT